MYKLYLLYILFFYIEEFFIGNIPINIVDLIAFVFGSQTLLNLLFNNLGKLNIYTRLFINSDFKKVTLIGYGIILVYIFFSGQTIINSVLLGVRMFYMYISIFFSIFLMNESFKYIEKSKNNIFIFFNILSISSFVPLVVSLINSLLGRCRVVYGGNFCFLNQTSYSANGYISLSVLFINISIFYILNNYNIRYKNIIYTKILILINCLISGIIVTNSGSRGAAISLLIIIATLFWDKFINFLSLKNLIFSIGSFAIFSYLNKAIVLSQFRSFSFLFLNNIGEFFQSTKRFQLEIFRPDNFLFGTGNFQNAPNPFRPSAYDGTLRIFTISYGIIGFLFFVYFIYIYIKKLISIRKKSFITGKPGSSKFIYVIFFYSITSSFSNELIILNGISTIHTFSYIMPLMLINYFCDKYVFIKYQSNYQ